nr:hypothetical protein [Dyella sp. ASV24]
MFRRNLFEGYLVQAYSSLIGILLMPLYLHLMGGDAFGLVGIFLMVQAWVQLLDMGLTPTFSREMSRLRAGILKPSYAAALIQGFEWILGSLAVVCVLAMFMGRTWLAFHWLHGGDAIRTQMPWCLVAMVMSAVMRWQAGLYRSGLAGLEHQSWVNGAIAVSVTFRYVGVLGVLYLTHEPLSFFVYQVVIAALEWQIFRWKLHTLVGVEPLMQLPDFRLVRSILPMAGAMAFLGAAWLAQTQLDKLVLSKMLPLKDFGHFTMAAMVAGGMLMLLPPLSQVVQPRLTILFAQGEEARFNELYSTVTQLVTVMFGSIGMTFSLMAGPLLFAWTGNPSLIDSVGPILKWYGLVNAIYGVLFMPYMLQVARGKMRMQVVGTIVFLLILVPGLVAGAMRNGAAGVGMVLLLLNLAYLVIWVPLIHHRLLDGRAMAWLLVDVLPIGIIIFVCVSAFSYWAEMVSNRWQAAGVVVMAIAVSALAGATVGGKSRQVVAAYLWGRRGKA